VSGNAAAFEQPAERGGILQWDHVRPRSNARTGVLSIRRTHRPDRDFVYIRAVPPRSTIDMPASHASSTDTPDIEICAAAKTFESDRGDVQALVGIDLTVGRGEFVSVVGPSGCGKSTLLKCIAGLERLTSGSLAVRGTPVTECPDDLGIVFQRDLLVDWRTILDNVLLVAEFRRYDRRKARSRALELLELFGLADYASRFPWELSGGMRQRASICRALVDDPGMLLMDEPFGALDAMTRDQLNVELQRMWLATGKTVLFITHGIAEAVFLSDRVAVMSRNPGRVIEIIDIDLPRPRALSVREAPQFTRYTAHLRDVFLSLGILKDE
jgi:NitT/TauT family transport system ATP-binding protein